MYKVELNKEQTKRICNIFHRRHGNADLDDPEIRFKIDEIIAEVLRDDKQITRQQSDCFLKKMWKYRVTETI